MGRGIMTASEPTPNRTAPTPNRTATIRRTTGTRSRGTHGIAAHDLVTRGNLRLERDPGRVITRLLAPGTRPAMVRDRPTDVIERVLSLDDREITDAYHQTVRTFGRRHRGLQATFEENFRAMRHRVPVSADLDTERRLLIGALFTHEIAVEGAALTNPSMVPHPDQNGLEPGALRFVMSARAIGEGHISAIEFRTGVVAPDGAVGVDPPSPYAACGVPDADSYRRSLLAEALGGAEEDDEVAAFLLRRLPTWFCEADIERGLSQLPAQLRVLDKTHKAIADVHRFLACQYRESFEEGADLSERVLWPMSPDEHSGLEDARFVRFTDADGRTDYRATYTANGGTATHPHLLRTTDFRTFSTSQMFGRAAGEKDLALFPRPVRGRYLAMSRWDREHNAVAASEDGLIWPHATVLHVRPRAWRLMKTGNCGPPIETDAGWLVLTHGVGPMRAYALGAMLLDLEHPTRVLGVLDEPLLQVTPEDRDGYVPNVVYSCGALKNGDTLVIPYGFGDMGIEFATAPISELLALLCS
jgi:predicted GH43/DUF377 family glycosyl hydrolase